MARNEDNNGNRANSGRSSGGSRNNGDGSGFKWNLVVKLGVLARYSNGWTKELNMVEWNGNPAKFDIRDWDETHDHMSRGITLHREEAAKLYRLLGNQFEDTIGHTAEHNAGPVEKDDFDENAGSDEPGYGADTAFADAGPLIEEANNAEDIGGMSTDEEADYLAKSA